MKKRKNNDISCNDISYNDVSCNDISNNDIAKNKFFLIKVTICLIAIEFKLLLLVNNIKDRFKNIVVNFEKRTLNFI